LTQTSYWTAEDDGTIVPYMFDMPTTLIDYHSTLKAVDRDRNIARSYHIKATATCSGTPSLSYGGVGSADAAADSLSRSPAGRRPRTSSARPLLSERAPARIGVAYTVVGAVARPEPAAQPTANENP
jgi:hypothetical protein